MAEAINVPDHDLRRSVSNPLPTTTMIELIGAAPRSMPTRLLRAASHLAVSG